MDAIGRLQAQRMFARRQFQHCLRLGHAKMAVVVIGRNYFAGRHAGNVNHNMQVAGPIFHLAGRFNGEILGAPLDGATGNPPLSWGQAPRLGGKNCPNARRPGRATAARTPKNNTGGD